MRRLSVLVSTALVVGTAVLGAPPAVAADPPEEPIVTALVGTNPLGNGLPADDVRLVARSAVDVGDATYLLDQVGLRKIDAAGVITTLRPYSTAREVVSDGTSLYVLDGPYVDHVGLDGTRLQWGAYRAGLFDIDVAGGRLYGAINPNLGDYRIESVEIGTTSWSLVAGGDGGWGDGGAATDAYLAGLASVAVHPTNGDVYVGQQRAVRRVSGGVIETVAGSQAASGNDAGDGGAATAAVVTPRHLAVAPDGTVYVGTPSVETEPATVRRFSPGGTITAFASSQARCLTPRVAVTAARVLLPCGNVDAYDPATADRTRAAGTDGTGSSDGTPAELSWESAMTGIAPGAEGRPYFGTEDRIRQVTPEGTVTTIAGGGNPEDGWGDGPAAGARLRPRALATGPDGSVYVADRRVSGESRVRRVKDGVVSTVVGGGTGAAAEGLAPTAPAFSYIHSAAVDAAGDVWFVDQDNRVWRVTDGALDLVTTLAQHSNCCGLSWDPYGARMLASRGSDIVAIAVDGTVTQAAHILSGPVTAAGPDGTVFGTRGWARRGNVLVPYFGWGIGPNGEAARFSRGTVVQAFVTADGSFWFADAERREVRRIGPQPATDAPVGVAAPTVTPGPGSLSVVPDPNGGSYQPRITAGTSAPAFPSEGTGDGTWRGEPSTGAFSVHRLPAGQPYSLSLFYGGYATTRDVLVHSFTATPLVDDVAPPQVTDVAADPANDWVTWTTPDDPDVVQSLASWAYGTTPPATFAEGLRGPLPPSARYSDIAFSVFTEDIVGNMSAPVSVVLPKLTLGAGGPSPAFAGYDSHQQDKRLSLWHHGGRVQYALGTAAPATVNDGTRISCDACTGGGSPTGKVAFLDGAVYGQRYALSVFNETDDGLHYTRNTYVAVFGSNTTRDTISIAATPVAVLTGAPVTLKGVVKQGGTNAVRAASRVELWARTLPATTFTRVAIGTTTAAGAYSFTARPRVNTYYQVRTGVNDPLAPAMSASAAYLVKVTPIVAGRLSSGRVPYGTKVRVYGSINPGGVRRLVLQRWTGSGWTGVVTKTTDGYGRTYHDVLHGRGTHRYRWYAPASHLLNAANGATLTFVVY